MKSYEKPILEEELIEIEDIVANSPGVKDEAGGWINPDGEDVDLGDILP